MTFSIKTIKRPKDAALQIAAVRSEVANQLQSVGRQHVSQRQAVVKGWQPTNRPEFESKVSVTEKQVTLTVTITNSGNAINKYGTTIAQLWNIINKGTKPRIIIPRFATVLRFAIGNAVVFTRLVRHPGTTGKHHDERINDRLRTALKAGIDRGVRLGLRRK